MSIFNYSNFCSRCRVLLYLVCIECLSSNARVVDDLEFWVDPRINYRKANDLKIRNYPHENNQLNIEVIPYSNATTEVSKWPKEAPQFRARNNVPRITKMLRQKFDTTRGHRQQDTSEEMHMSNFSPYAIKKQLEYISKKFPDTNITLDVIGRTVEYKDIVLMKISQYDDTGRHFRAHDDKFADEPPKKKIVFIVHGLTVMGIKKHESLGNEAGLLKLMSFYMQHLDKFDIFFIPMANPDGISTANEFIWNKNMSPQLACPGVNVDRNFDVAWNSTADISSCSQHYPGVTPFTEAESKAIRDVFHKYSGKIVAYINVHYSTYEHDTFKGEAVLYPKGYTDIQTDDDKYIDLKGEIDESLRNASFQTFPVTIDSLYSWYGKVFGTSVDYASTVYGVPYALEFAMQLYDNSYMDTEETYSTSAINEVWSRIIEVVLAHIWKSTHSVTHEDIQN